MLGLLKARPKLDKALTIKEITRFIYSITIYESTFWFSKVLFCFSRRFKIETIGGNLFVALAFRETNFNRWKGIQDLSKIKKLQTFSIGELKENKLEIARDA